MTAAIELDKVTKRFGDRPVLDGMTLKVEPGSIFALLGDNGTGKSTSMKILTGQIAADSGTARLLGRDAWRDAVALRHEVGYVPEKPKFYDWMTVAELGRFVGGFHHEGFCRRFTDASERLGLDTSRKLADLSKGGYARAGLALALAIDPKVLLLDEPTSGLDLSTRREFLTGMVELAAEGRTILITSHQIAEVERVASHVGLMAGGKLVMCLPMEELKRLVVRVIVQGVHEAEAVNGLGRVLQADRFGDIWRAIVHLPDPEAIERVASIRDAGAVKAERLTLEEIYGSVIGAHGGFALSSSPDASDTVSAFANGGTDR
jgi:ABC-2 type transport system ATP-binding protein